MNRTRAWAATPQGQMRLLQVLILAATVAGAVVASVKFDDLTKTVLWALLGGVLTFATPWLKDRFKALGERANPPVSTGCFSRPAR